MQPERGDTTPLEMSHMIGRKGRNKTMYLDLKTMGLQAISVQWKSKNAGLLTRETKFYSSREIKLITYHASHRIPSQETYFTFIEKVFA